jgi:hypothetical protein
MDRAVEKLRMQLPVRSEFAGYGPVVASEQDNVITGVRRQRASELHQYVVPAFAGATMAGANPLDAWEHAI